MYQDGFTKITNIDYSDVVIKKMAAVHKVNFAESTTNIGCKALIARLLEILYYR